MLVTEELRVLLEEREDRAKERMHGVLTAIETLRLDIRAGAQGIHTRLDTLNGKVARHEDRLSVIEQRTAYQDGARLSPVKETRTAGDEEMVVRVTPKMWAALVTVGSLLYTALHFLFELWRVPR